MQRSSGIFTNVFATYLCYLLVYYSMLQYALNRFCTFVGHMSISTHHALQNPGLGQGHGGPRNHRQSTPQSREAGKRAAAAAQAFLAEREQRLNRQPAPRTGQEASFSVSQLQVPRSSQVRGLLQREDLVLVLNCWTRLLSA